jgi:hypothetical protein
MAAYPSYLRLIGSNDANNNGASDLVVANNDGSLLERAEYITTDLLALPRCVEKTADILTGTDPIFDVTGGPIKVIEITGIVTTLIVSTSSAKITYTTVAPAATVDLCSAVAIDDDAAGTSYQLINTTGVFTPVTAGVVKEASSFATLPTQYLLPIGQMGFNCTAARVGVVKWYLRYVPLSPNSRVVAAA